MKTLLFFFLVLSCHLHAEKVAVVIPRPFVDQAITQALIKEGLEVVKPSSFNATALNSFFHHEKPTAIILDGYNGSVSDMLAIDMRTISYCLQAGVEKVVFLASFAIYPPDSAIPFREEQLFKQPLDKITDPYTLAKRTTIQQFRQENSVASLRFVTCLYPFLFGSHNSHDEPIAHPLKHVHERLAKAKKDSSSFALISNDGKALYELLHVEDLASAVTTVLQRDVEFEVINIGSGKDESIEILAKRLYSASDYRGELIFDINCYDEVPRRVLSNRRIISVGWTPRISTTQGLQEEIALCLKP